MIEAVFNGLAERRPFFSLLISFVAVCIAYGLSFIFEARASLITIFLTTLMLTPLLVRMLDQEISRDVKRKAFYETHKDVFEVFLFTFVGVFAAYLVLGSLLGMNHGLFEFQTGYIGESIDVVVANFLDGPLLLSFENFLGIFAHNAIVALIAFGLSFLYGLSAIFLIILNASVFAVFLLRIIDVLASTTAQAVKYLLFFAVHLLPEMGGFLLAAAAGGIISKAMMGGFKKNEQKRIIRDATYLLLLGFGLILIAAGLEAFVSTSLFYHYG